MHSSYRDKHDDMVTLFQSLNWSDLESIQRSVGPWLVELAEDKARLRGMILDAANNPSLFARFERHLLLDYFVLYVCPKTDSRLRVHLHTDVHKQRPHNHRFPFCTLILRGDYIHHWNKSSISVNERMALDKVDIAYISTERAGSSYTISNEAIHTTYTSPNTISLLVRGPAFGERSIIMDRETGITTWRETRDAESAERRARVSMNRKDFEALQGKLEALEVI